MNFRSAAVAPGPDANEVWIFGYGSLIWRPGFDYLERRRARLRGWQRRFWQGSHDHRGVPERPGRVVTLVQTGGGHCDGVAYRVERATLAAVFEDLDHREKNGYQRFDVVLEGLDSNVDAISAEQSSATRTAFARSRPTTAEIPRIRDPARSFERVHEATLRAIAPAGAPPTTFPAVVYIAPTDNFAYLGPAPVADMVRQIVTSHGPSGANLEYLLRLAEALRHIEADDPHVFELESAARRLGS